MRSINKNFNGNEEGEVSILLTRDLKDALLEIKMFDKLLIRRIKNLENRLKAIEEACDDYSELLSTLRTRLNSMNARLTTTDRVSKRVGTADAEAVLREILGGKLIAMKEPAEQERL